MTVTGELIPYLLDQDLLLGLERHGYERHVREEAMKPVIFGHERPGPVETDGQVDEEDSYQIEQ